MKLSRILILLLLGFSWLILPLAGWKSIKRFMPASLFMSIFVLVEDAVAEKCKWWIVYPNFSSRLRGIIPFAIGPFFTGSIFILKYTYGKLPLFLFLNLVMDTFFVYPFYKWFKKLGVWTLIRMSQLQLLTFFLTKSMLMYGFHHFFIAKRESDH
ncbi:hypothetical protein V1502_03590 [Bacillus sp. SCS-153A]|uniref:hypothetical protein n=1 Tax=Rossellomorea sedimentorum TaxID=3115294 RepID=UPI00390591D8